MIYNAMIFKKRPFPFDILRVRALYIDTMAENITNHLRDANVRFKVKHCFCNNTYKICMCTILRTYNNVKTFLDVLEQMQDKVYLCGYPSYKEDCEKLMTYLSKGELPDEE